MPGGAFHSEAVTRLRSRQNCNAASRLACKSWSLVWLAATAASRSSPASGAISRTRGKCAAQAAWQRGLMPALLSSSASNSSTAALICARARFAAPPLGVPSQCGGRGPLQMRSRHRGFAGGTGRRPRLRRRRQIQHPRPALRSPRASRSRARRTCGASCPSGDGPRHTAPSPLSAGCNGEAPSSAPHAGAAGARARARIAPRAGE